jgi:hypothetical protein
MKMQNAFSAAITVNEWKNGESYSCHLRY